MRSCTSNAFAYFWIKCWLLSWFLFFEGWKPCAHRIYFTFCLKYMQNGRPFFFVAIRFWVSTCPFLHLWTAVAQNKLLNTNCMNMLCVFTFTYSISYDTMNAHRKSPQCSGAQVFYWTVSPWDVLKIRFLTTDHMSLQISWFLQSFEIDLRRDCCDDSSFCFSEHLWSSYSQNRSIILTEGNTTVVFVCREQTWHKTLRIESDKQILDLSSDNEITSQTVNKQLSKHLKILSFVLRWYEFEIR